jgi:hypothetical protein
MAASCCSCVTWRFVPPYASVAMLMPCVWVHAPVGARPLVWGGDFSCEVETCRARRRPVVRGEDLSRRGSSSKKLVGDAPNWPKTGCLASVGLDQNLLSSLSWIFALTSSILAFTLSMVLECLVWLGEIISLSKGVLIRALVTQGNLMFSSAKPL